MSLAGVPDLRRSRRCVAPWIAPHNPFDLRTLNLGDSLSAAALGRGRQGGVPAGHRRPGPRRAVGDHVRRARLAAGRPRVGRVRARARRVARPRRRLRRRQDRRVHHARRRRAALVPRDPDRAPDRRRGRVALPRDAHDQVAVFVLVLAIGLSNWVQYARTVRGSTMVEKNKEYVQAARVIGVTPARHHGAPPAAQRAGPGARARDHQHRHGHPHRGDAVVPRRGRAADRSRRSAR